MCSAIKTLTHFKVSSTLHNIRFKLSYEFWEYHTANMNSTKLKSEVYNIFTSHTFYKEAVPDADSPRCFVNKVLLKVLQNSQGKHLRQSLFLNKVACNIIKRLWRRCFPMNLTKFLRTPFCRTRTVAASPVPRHLSCSPSCLI